MPKKPSNRKISVRYFDPRLIHKGCSYTAKDLALLYNVGDSVIHRWVREEGLISIDDKTPAIFHYATLKQFLTHKNQSRKMTIGNKSDFPCLCCYTKRRAYKDKITVNKLNDKFWKAKGICACCGSKMNMNTPANEILLTITWGYELVETLPEFSLIGTNNPSTRTTGRRGQLNSKFEYCGIRNFHPNNERIKHKYFDRVALKLDKKTVAKIVSAVWIFDEFNKFKDFKLFKYEDAKEFQKYLLKRYSHSMQMANNIVTCVKEFFSWLREQDGYKKLAYDDVDSLELSYKDREKSKTSRPKDYLDAEKWQDLILSLRPQNEFEWRGTAMLACLLLTGARVDALISFQIGDFYFDRNYAFQDSNHVNTKFSSSHKTNLWKFKPEIRQILIDWIKMLRTKYSFNDSDPLFPKIHLTTNDKFQFEKDGFIKEPIKSTAIVRQELTKQLRNANLGHYTPHTIRNSLVALFMGFDLTPEQQKAVSQNMSHKSLSTTMGAYYKVHEYRQDTIIEELDVETLIKLQKLKNNPKYQFILSQMSNEEMINKLFYFISKDC